MVSYHTYENHHRLLRGHFGNDSCVLIGGGTWRKAPAQGRNALTSTDESVTSSTKPTFWNPVVAVLLTKSRHKNHS